MLAFSKRIGWGIDSSDEDELEENWDDDVGDLGFSIIDAPSTRLFVKPPLNELLFKIDDEWLDNDEMTELVGDGVILLVRCSVSFFVMDSGMSFESV